VSKLWALIFVVGLIFAMGRCSAEEQDLPAPAPGPTVTKVETKTVEKKIKVPYVPASCLRMAALADKAHEGTNTFRVAIKDQEEVVNDVMAAINFADHQRLNRASEKQIEIKDKMMAPMQDLASVNDELRNAVSNCRKDTQ
jgi:hypothetical protein